MNNDNGDDHDRDDVLTEKWTMVYFQAFKHKRKKTGAKSSELQDEQAGSV